MKPLNLDNSPCSPISSNCIVWQGPDIPCIHLCTGDTISDVVNKLAIELCTVLDTLKVSNYDLSCFNLQACGPDDFQALIQFLITKICENEGVTPATDQTSGCPSCVVSVAECFVIGTQRTMELVDYVQLIGARICNLITEVSLINDQLVDIITRVTILENTSAPSLAMPSFTIGCQVGSLLSGSSNQIDTLLEEFINNVWCGYVAATGNTSELTAAVGRACITDASISLVNGNAMSIGYAGQWVDDASYSSVANAINNLWIALCDIFTYLSTNTFIITVADTSTVNLNLTAGNELTAKIQDTGWVNLEGFNWYSGTAANNGFLPQCRRIGSVIHFRGTAVVPIAEADVATILPITAPTTYDTSLLKAPAVGTGAGNIGAVVLNTDGSVTWNQGLRVIPTTVLAAIENLDGAYKLPFPTVMTRSITIGVNGTRLNSAGSGGINSDGQLFFSTIKNSEVPSGMGALLVGASTLRYITSNIRVGEYVPNFINTDTDIQNFPGTGINPLLVETGFATSDVVWPLTLDAGNQAEVGGFQLNLDGLVAFISCNATAAIHTCDT
tara:strand:- start:1249 stop:2922 length:1674 start_codon:yes stop_codon:yes gene_type:complete